MTRPSTHPPASLPADWETIWGECGWNDPHLFRYDPDPDLGGTYFVDQAGDRWSLRTCAVCGVREKRREATR